MHKLLVALILGLVFVSAGPAATAAAGKPVVRAILFTSPTCPHCAQVREEVRQCIAAGGPGGGYMISSSNSIPSYARPENVQAMVDAIRDYAPYPLRV